MIRIPYEAENFPTGTVRNGSHDLRVSWDDILWAAVTVGRPNRSYVFRHGAASVFEAVFRWSLVRSALEQASPHGYRVRRTAAAKTLDPTEKGAVNYFLGMTFCKLFAAKLLDTPWLLHLDVFRPHLDPVLSGRSRPDLIGQQCGVSRWHAFECKGRVSSPDRTTKGKAKSQAQRLVSVKGTACSLHIGAVTYFRGDRLSFYWCDPPPEGGRPIKVPLNNRHWRYYYGPVLELIKATEPSVLRRDSDALVVIEGADIEVGIHPAVAKHLVNGNWESARNAASQALDKIVDGGYQPDGLIVRAGPSWAKSFDETLPEQG